MTDPVRGFLIVVGLAMTVGVGQLGAQDEPTQGSLMRDPLDGAFDLSAWLATPAGFLPLVNPITEPAVGYGIGVGILFIHRPEGWTIEAAREAYETRQRMALPSITGGFGMYTANDSWLAGLGHMGIWGGGRWRYTGGGFVNRLNLSRAGEVPGFGEVLFDYSLEGWGIFQALRYRLGASDFLVGGLFNVLGMESRFLGDALPDATIGQVTLSSLGATISYDSRNSTFTTDRGVFAQLEWKAFLPALGSDAEYGFGKATFLGFVDPLDALVVGVRVEGSKSGEAAPFWARPSVDMRGIARGRYAGDHAGVLATEIRWDVTGRWSVLGFGGAGWYDTDDEPAAWVGSGGTGFRYLLARAFNMRGGVDFAWGRDGFAFYLTTGSAWPTF